MQFLKNVHVYNMNHGVCIFWGWSKCLTLDFTIQDTLKTVTAQYKINLKFDWMLSFFALFRFLF